MINVLIVDDHSIIIESVKLILSKIRDIKIISWASNGEEAINYLKKNNKIDVVLMDINMPIMNGIKATEILKKKYKKLNVVALTMHEEKKFVIPMLRAGAIGYLLKEDSGVKKLAKAIRAANNGEKYYSYKISKLIANILLEEKKSGLKKTF